MGIYIYNIIIFIIYIYSFCDNVTVVTGYTYYREAIIRGLTSISFSLFYIFSGKSCHKGHMSHNPLIST